ncbi:leucine-rich repeat protein, putative [Plasmodium relictum]|uniref:Leucine-rich repeat protein, putative n=1 Tax=Plasmodium relictum TaxID=85471 RepID=A0A1J1H2W8_PLARL|nr:leucine-rich repeat protein, putative [Plasmodium relictum]CRG99276.1 leucine-rich repeat protein, putative [Plasmodium relictum]
MDENLTTKNYNEEDENNSRVFIFFERQYDIDNGINIILNFKKLKLNNEQNFLEIINLNKNNIIRDIIKIKKKLEVISNSINNHNNKKELNIQWELDLSFNYFKIISIDSILSILIEQNIINEKENIFYVNNLKTLNLRKNCLKKFPYICNYKLNNLTNLCLSHNDINDITTINNENNLLNNNCLTEKINYDNNKGVLNEIIPNLKNIYLQNNKIESFSFIKYLFNHHKEIININISFNKIKYLCHLPFLKSLKYLDISFNALLCCNIEDTEYKNITKELENSCKKENNDLYKNDSDFTSYHFLLTFKNYFPNLKNINTKNNHLYNLNTI